MTRSEIFVIRVSFSWYHRSRRGGTLQAHTFFIRLDDKADLHLILVEYKNETTTGLL
jgi:hypothetical protein